MPATDMTVARTILQQLGGNRFVMMTGAKHLTGSENTLSFKLPGNPGFVKNGINHVRIVLMPSDTYKVEFNKIRGTNVIKVETLHDVYCDELRAAFTRETGLDTHL